MKNQEKRSAFRSYLYKKGITLSPKVYFVDAMGAMALGLFATLLVSTIFGTVLSYLPLGNVFYDLVANITAYTKAATGVALGVAVAYSLKAPPLVMFSAGAVGLCANGLPVLIESAGATATAGPAGAFLAALVATEIGKLVSKTTKVDIIVTPAVTLGVGVGVSMLICPPLAYLLYWLGAFVKFATDAAPFVMGVVIAVVVGVVLTLPISSAALCAMIGISGIAGGAAMVGCSAQMVGFAVASFRENKWSGIIAQGLGTSMLQMGNIVKRPQIWIAPTLASAICGPISTCVFKLECSGVAAGMGTCGLVGPLGAFADMGFTSRSILGVLTLAVVLPAILSLLFSEIFRKLGLVREGDMRLEL